MEITRAQKQYFTKQLMGWHHTANDRDLPWKGEKDPYKIWLSEIILQQTRAQQGLPYYLAFIRAYPDVKALAGAKDEDAFRLWQGLGYYNRCRNMLATARYIATGLKGKFPRSYEGLLALKGVGPYTAAAIGSFAFGLPNAVVDGNVYRVLARYFGIATPYDGTEGKKQFAALAQELLDAKNSAHYNQAIMDLGATVCTPAAAKCADCPLAEKCIAYNNDIIAHLPVKSKKTEVKTRYFHYLLLHNGDMLWLHRRMANDIWQNLYEPLLVEDSKPLGREDIARLPILKKAKIPASAIQEEGYSSQRLSHRIIETKFFSLTSKVGSIGLPTDGIWVKISQLKNYAFPKTVLSFLEKKLYF